MQALLSSLARLRPSRRARFLDRAARPTGAEDPAARGCLSPGRGRKAWRCVVHTVAVSPMPCRTRAAGAKGDCMDRAAQARPKGVPSTCLAISRARGTLSVRHGARRNGHMNNQAGVNDKHRRARARRHEWSSGTCVLARPGDTTEKHLPHPTSVSKPRTKIQLWALMGGANSHAVLRDPCDAGVAVRL